MRVVFDQMNFFFFLMDTLTDFSQEESEKNQFSRIPLIGSGTNQTIISECLTSGLMPKHHLNRGPRFRTSKIIKTFAQSVMLVAIVSACAFDFGLQIQTNHHAQPVLSRDTRPHVCKACNHKSQAQCVRTLIM